MTDIKKELSDTTGAVSAAKPASLARKQPWRYGLAAVGILCVGIGAVGVVVPGLPTTIFLLAASACFAKSCPWLEQKLLQNRFFRPYMAYLDGSRPMSATLRARIIAIIWACSLTSVFILAIKHTPGLPLIAATIIVTAIIGTLVVRRWNPASPCRDSSPIDPS